MLFEGKEREKTRKVRGGELFWGRVAPSRGIVGALLSRSRAFSGVLSRSQSIARLPVITCRLAVLSSRRPVVPQFQIACG